MNISLFVAGKRGDLAALIAGSCTILAFAPFNLASLIIVCFTVFMLCLFYATPKQAFWRGWLFGLGMFGWGASWVHVSMNEFGGVGVPLSIFLTFLFVLFMSLYPAIMAWASRKFYSSLKDRAGLQFLLVLPMLWVLFEWVRSWLFTGFPWLIAGYSQIDMPFSGLAPIFGIFSISFAILLCAGLIAYALVCGRKKLKPIIASFVLLWLVTGMLTQVDWTDPVGEPLTVSMIQGNVSQDRKWLPEQRKPTMDMYASLSRENWDSDLIIWPETAIPGFYHQMLPYLQGLAQEARMNSSEIVLGIPVYDQRQKYYYNSMVSIGRDTGFYEKRHLVPFGEFLPLPGLFGGIIKYFNIPMSDFRHGDDSALPVLKLAGQYVGISICFEDAFGDEIVQALPNATLLLNASNDAWFGTSIAPHQHLQIARMRSLETGRYLMRSTNTGVSAIIDPKGNIQSASPQFEKHVLTDKVQPMTGMTPYAVFSNSPVVFVLILSFFGLLIYNRNLKKQESVPNLD